MYIRYILMILGRLLIQLTSIVIFPVLYPFRTNIQRLVYTVEGKEIVGKVDCEVAASSAIKERLEAEGIQIGYKNSSKLWYVLYPIAKVLWLYLKDDGYDAGSPWWIETYMNNDNGQEPLVAGCFYRIGDAAHTYKVTNRLRHFWSVYRYTGLRNNAWNYIDFISRMPEDRTIVRTKGNYTKMVTKDGRQWFYWTPKMAIAGKSFTWRIGWKPTNRRLYGRPVKD